MQLLVSVADPTEARIAWSAGAGIVDVKDPREGALGAPHPSVLRSIAAAVPHAELSVALGDLQQAPNTAALAAAGAVAAGARTVKAGLRGSRTIAEAVAMLAAVRDGVAGSPDVAVVAVGYADRGRLPEPPLELTALVAAAANAGVDGCLVDTAIKDGRGLLAWRSVDELTGLARIAHDGGLQLGLAGQVAADEIPSLGATGADLVGVRSAACLDGDRGGALDGDRVRALAELCAAARPPG